MKRFLELVKHCKYVGQATGISEHCCGRSFKKVIVQEVACVPLPKALV